MPGASTWMSMTPAVALQAIVPRRALVVDDEGAIRDVLRRWLERKGWVVDEAPDGSEAVRVLGAHDVPRPRSYDLIISDMRMPGMNGPALHAWLREHRPELLPRFVVSSGDLLERETEDFVTGTRCRVLPKPFDLEQLSALLVPPVIPPVRRPQVAAGSSRE